VADSFRFPFPIKKEKKKKYFPPWFSACDFHIDGCMVAEFGFAPMSRRLKKNLARREKCELSRKHWMYMLVGFRALLSVSKKFRVGGSRWWPALLKWRFMPL